MILKTFSLDVKPSKVETFAMDGVNGATLELTIFSKANNRNKAYFDITNLLYTDETCKKLIFNFNHDKNDVLGGPLVNQLSNVRLEQGQNSAEIKATFNSTDTKFLERLESITGVSIEIMVEPEYIFSFEGGEFYSEIEWSGMAFLTGVMAGSGNSRVNEISTYSLENNLENNNNNININYMSDQQAQAIIDALNMQNQTLNLILQEIIKDNETETEEINMSANENVVDEIKPIEETETVTETETKEENAQEEQLNKTEEFINKLKKNDSSELVTDRKSGDETANKSFTYAEFMNKLIS